MHASARRWTARLIPYVLLCAAVCLVASEVRRPAALINLGVRWGQIGTLALIMTPIVITGGIDLSVGSIVALSSMIMGVSWSSGLPVWLAATFAMLTGLAAGAVNGTLVVAGLSPLVTTLGTMALYSGLAMTVSGAERITSFPESTVDLSQLAGIPTEYGLFAVTLLVTFIGLHHTRFGRWCFAIGDNVESARFSAVPVNAMQWWLYCRCGLVAGLLGVIYTSRSGAIPDAHRGIELEVIACIVVGGTLITGGRGGILQTVLGIAVISNLDIGLYFLSSRVRWLGADARLMVVGVMLITIAVTNEWLAKDEAGRGSTK